MWAGGLSDGRCQWVVSINYPIWRAFGLTADGDGEFEVLWDVLEGWNDFFGSCIRKVVAFYVCVLSDFAYYCR